MRPRFRENEASALLKSERSSGAAKRTGTLQLRVHRPRNEDAKGTLSVRVRVLDPSAPDARSMAEDALAMAVELATPVQCVVKLPSTLSVGIVVGRGGRCIDILQRSLQTLLHRAVTEAAPADFEWSTPFHLQVTPEGLGAVALVYPVRDHTGSHCSSSARLSSTLVKAARKAIREALLVNLTCAVRSADMRSARAMQQRDWEEEETSVAATCSYEGERDLLKAHRAAKRDHDGRARQRAMARKCTEARRAKRWRSGHVSRGMGRSRGLAGSSKKQKLTKRDRMAPMRTLSPWQASSMVKSAREDVEEC